MAAQSDVIRFKDKFYILATSSLADNRTRVLKCDETFAVFDRYGDIHSHGQPGQGLFRDGTRFLSRLILRLGTERPLLLSSTVRENNSLVAVDLTNADVYRHGELIVPRGTLHIFRSKFLWRGICYERLRLSNYGPAPVDVRLSVEFEADFADLFELRGMKRERRGQRLEPAVTTDSVELSYRGLDEIVRRSRLTYSPDPTELTASKASFATRIEPRQECDFHLDIACQSTGQPGRVPAYRSARQQAERSIADSDRGQCRVRTSNEQFNEWLDRSLADLRMMTTTTAYGPYPFAGVPWYSTVFGRDGIITALEMLWVRPGLARGVLAYLAARQARSARSDQEAEPGKILHETRRGEMARLGEVPFRRYYGSVDATPLFIVLAHAYYERSGDRSFLEGIWPNIEAALGWIDTRGDTDGDGFVEYSCQSDNGLANQGWKDSRDSIFHSDGSLAHDPIALCEVQAYVYAAKRAAAALARILGRNESAERLDSEAEELEDRFEKAFWCDDLATYALALDGDKRPCRVRSSNAGHCLFAGIASPERANRVAETLFGKDFFSGWGVRTVAASEARYNPMAYHNGSIWPHDNAIIAAGLANYGFKRLAAKTLASLFDACRHVDLYRMPELFCGFPRRRQEGPTLYPVACKPQSWAAGAVFLLLQACLGLSIDTPRAEVRFVDPFLPAFLERVEISDLWLGPYSVDLSLHRHPEDVAIHLVRRSGPVKVVTVA